MNTESPKWTARIRRWLRDLPIAKKLTFFSVTTSVASLLLAVLAILVYQHYASRETVKTELSVLASVISGHSTEAIVFNDRDIAEFTLRSLKFRESIVAACIYKIDAEKRHSPVASILAHYPTKATPCPKRVSAATDVFATPDSDHLQLIHPITLGNSTLGYIYLETDTSAIELQHTKLMAVLLLVLLGGILISLWLANTFSQWMVGPLLVLGKTARAISGKENYQLRAKKFSNDEVGQVVDSFNQMLETIEREDASLRESEEKFRLISASSTAGIFQTDTEGHCIYANDALAHITGLNTNDILNNNWLHAIHHDDRPSIDEQWHRMVEDKHTVTINCRIQSVKMRWISGHIEPLKSADGAVIGFLGTISDITDVKNAQIQLEQMAFYDTLTGLANRRLFRKRLENVIDNTRRNSAGVGLILIDLDHFKNTNDSLGHDAGDALLKLIAARLQHCVRASDTVARLGGDEFAIILPGISSTVSIAQIAQKILDSLKQPAELRDAAIRITASAGIAKAPEDAGNAEILIKNADLALYRAKDVGRDNYQFFTDEMNTRLIDHLELIKDLREAVESEQFSLVFQPQITLKTRELIGFEALIRWQHKTRGSVSPMDFIPAAEETGLILTIGRWVITQACRQLRELQRQKLVNASVIITVNLSAKQFQDDELVDFIHLQLREFDLLPNQLEVELTESVLMENLDDAVDKLQCLRDLGVLISIDDFGTGYSSLGYLKKLPVNIVKVDRSFVVDIPHNKDDMEITAAVIAMAHSLQYEVVAEGVETMEQLQFLEQCGCDFGQGYLFGKPLLKSELFDYCKTCQADNRVAFGTGV